MTWILWDHIVIDQSTGLASYLGQHSQPFAYKPALRKRLAEIEQCHGDNRFFVMEGEILRADQTTRKCAMQYMAPGRVLVELA